VTHRNRRGHLRALNDEQRRALVHLYFTKRRKQVSLAIQFRISQSTVARYIAEAA
jgi:hypothetical protein